MNILSTLFVGLIAGLVGRFLIPGKTRPKGLIMTTLMGVIGAFLAAYLGQMVGIYRAGEPAGLLGAIVGAIIVLLIYNKLRKP